MAISFKGAHFPQEIILTGVRWYVAYFLSTHYVEILMQERGVAVDHSTRFYALAFSSPHRPGRLTPNRPRMNICDGTLILAVGTT